MQSTLAFHAPAGFGGTGRIRASVRGRAALLTQELQLRGTGLPWSALPGVDREATGGALSTTTAMATGIAVPAVAQRPKTVVLGAVAPFAGTTNPYSTLGIHSPGRPQS